MTYQILNPDTGEIVRTLDSAAVRRLQAAERRANWRNFDTRYGNNRRHPHGVMRSDRRPRKQPNPMVHILIGLTALGIAALAISTL